MIMSAKLRVPPNGPLAPPLGMKLSSIALSPSSISCIDSHVVRHFSYCVRSHSIACQAHQLFVLFLTRSHELVVIVKCSVILVVVRLGFSCPNCTF